MTAEPIRVVLIDDQTLVREAFALLLDRYDDLSVLASAGDGPAALQLISRTRPDVAVVDLRMPVMDGTSITRAITTQHPQTRVLLLTTYLHDSAVLPALRAGALGVIGKDATPDEVAAAIRIVARGGPVLPNSIQHTLLHGPAPTATELSSREVEVVRLMAEGFNNAQIAERLAIAVPTVKTHINNIFSKLGISNRSDAVTAATAARLLG